MPQEQIQEQRLTQQQKLTQGITQQQLLQAQLTELPITQLMERVNAEMDDNPALEISADEPLDNLDPLDNPDNSQSEADSYEKEERQSALEVATMKTCLFIMVACLLRMSAKRWSMDRPNPSTIRLRNRWT